MQDIPFESPRSAPKSSLVSVGEILTLLGASTLFFTALGGGIGYLLGTYLPEYYRSTFRNGQAPGLNPLAADIGQGLTQGVAGGATVGVILVVVLLRFRSRRFALDRHS